MSILYLYPVSITFFYRRFFLTLFALLAGSAALFATHNRAGAITYKHISGFRYEITITTYTNTETTADRPELIINYGDGTPDDTIPRVQEIVPLSPQYDTVKKNIYRKEHTFLGVGSYVMCVSDPNRVAGINNIAGSVDTQFGLSTTLVIPALTGFSNSVEFLYDPIQDGCVGSPWIFNPVAFDEDNDSLGFELVNPLGEACIELPNWTQVSDYNENPNGEISVDENGTIIWDSPLQAGNYVISLEVTEYNNGQIVGRVLLDLQIFIDVCNNQNPEIAQLADTCVEAGTTLNYLVNATDPDGDDVDLTLAGGAFQVASSPAFFVQIDDNPAAGNMQWETNCSHVRLAPYQTTVIATDDGNSPLNNVAQFNITVVAPAPENLEVVPEAGAMALSWSPSVCQQAAGYRIYRREGSFNFQPSNCETGVPEYTGYELVGETTGLNSTTFNDVAGVNFGTVYCYRVIAFFEDGAESYASDEVCGELFRDFPILTKLSIGVTDENNGTDTLRWEAPTELDTEVEFPGPYRYRVYRRYALETGFQQVFESEENADLNSLPGELISTGLNTVDSAIFYRVELYSAGILAATSNTAASIFVTPIPNDSEIEVTWLDETPWQNYSARIFRRNPRSTEFIEVGVSSTGSYRDTLLENNQEYCYYVITEGSYFKEGLPDPLFNHSQQVCAQPYDRTPPCPPLLFGQDNCETLEIEFNWELDEACTSNDDIEFYTLYYALNQNDTLRPLVTLNGAELRDYFFANDTSIAGCFAITATDGENLWPDGSIRRNESEFSNIVCYDNCPIFGLPNVFTPNGDGRNDVFIPVDLRSIREVNFQVFNRWGSVVFETKDPFFQWDGTSELTGEVVSDGTYFYACKAFAIRLAGLETINLSGTITVVSGVPPRVN